MNMICHCTVTNYWLAHLELASHANVLRGSSRNLSSPVRGGGKLRDEPLRTFAWEANLELYVSLKTCTYN